MPPLVSVIIPTKNSARTIGKCLESIQNQTHEAIEVIVVDNFSTDDTREIAKKYTANVFEKWPERTTQKNYGIEKANGEYVCFIDSDMSLGSAVIEQCVEKIKQSDTWGVCIAEHSVGGTFFAKVRDFERSFYEWTSVESARFFRLKDVKEVGWFEEDLIFFEESLLPQKIISKLHLDCTARIKEYIDHDESDIKLFNWFKKKYYYWRSIKEYQKKVQELWILSIWDTQIWIIGRYLVFLKNRRFYKKPILAIAVLKLKTFEFISGWLGLLFSKFQ